VNDPKKREGSGVFRRMWGSGSDRKGFRDGGERGLNMYVRRSESGGMSLRQVMVGVSLFVAIVFPYYRCSRMGGKSSGYGTDGVVETSPSRFPGWRDLCLGLRSLLLSRVESGDMRSRDGPGEFFQIILLSF
jgi:hypothetical protein